MATQDESLYMTTVEDEHWRDEEYQWVRILDHGSCAVGMVLLYIQKACTAFHEFEPAYNAGAVSDDHVDFFRGRLSKRVGQVLTTMQNNQLDTISGASELAAILHSIESAESAEQLAELSEQMHSVSHMLADSLETS